MSTFKVEVKRLSRVWEHPNADTLELASVDGMSFQFVVRKDSYRENDVVVYFPVDSMLPDDVIEVCGLTGRLSGSKKNRLKTVKLRGQISQGFVIGVNELLGFLSDDIKVKLLAGQVDVDVTEELGVGKYDPPVIPCRSGTLTTLPPDVGVYDIEGADRYPEAVEEMLDEKVWVSEKLEGTNWSLTVTKDDVFVSTRRHSIIEREDADNDYWSAARRQGFIGIARAIRAEYELDQLTLRGELVGPGWQGNIYKLEEQRVFLFDVLFHISEGYKYYASPSQLMSLSVQYGFKDMLVPTLHKNEILRDVLNGQTVQEFSNGTSLLNKTRREGIVIKPFLKTKRSEVLSGRLIIKQRSPEYLAKSDY